MRRTTIAIVDDDGSVRDALRQLLRSMGFDARTFESAEEFLVSGRAEDFDCLIVDLHLPGMSGSALVKVLCDAGTALPTVVITAHDDPTSLRLVREIGPVPHLHKPFNDDELAGAIHRVLTA